MIERAGVADTENLQIFFQHHASDAMFPLLNLAEHGVIPEGQLEAPNYAMRVWMIKRDQAIEAALCVTQEGMIMPVFSKTFDDFEKPDWRSALVGCMVSGGIGQAAAVRAVMRQVGVAELPTKVDADEPQYNLDLSNLQTPVAQDAELLPFSDSVREQVEVWCSAYNVETLGEEETDAEEKAKEDCSQYLKKDNHRVLLIDGQPVSKTGFNAEVGDIVQIGGVYTPPALRCRGYARLAVALHLEEARSRGITRSVLFAASEGAAKAYEAIGFERIGTFALSLLTNPVEIKA